MNNKTTLQLVRNATLKISYCGKTILIDPVFADKGTLISALGVNNNPRVHLTIPINEITEGTDLVLLTHNHIDHYEPSVKLHLHKDIPFFTQPQDKEFIENEGFTNVNSIENEKQFKEISIHRIDGHHGFGKAGEAMGASSGFILKADNQLTIYIMGDCRWDESTRNAVDNFKPDYIVVNCGGAVFPEISKHFGPIIPDEKEVMTMLDELPSDIRLIAVHMDAIDHCQTTRAILRNEAKQHNADMNRLIIPEDGQKVIL